MEPDIAGWFFDGQTPQRHPVVLTLARHALEIKHRDWSNPRHWPYPAIQVADLLEDGGARLCRSDSEERLVVGPAALALLGESVPALSARGRRRRSRSRAITAVAATIATVALFYFAWGPVADVLATMMPDSVADAIGRAAVAQLTSGRRRCGAPAGNAILEGLMTRLAASVSPPRHFRARVVETADVNAFAVPGGSIVIFRGVLDNSQSPNELAGVLAHEMGHVIENHPQRLLVRYSGLSLLSAGLLGDTSFANLGTTLVTLSYSREFESEADAKAIDLLAAANMDTSGLASFLARIEKRSSSEVLSTYLSSHPPTAKRRRDLERRAHAGAAALSPADWQELRRICNS